ncbi:MAG: class I tRNA ligase family protein, partial [Caldilinea sp.]|nr:class I tRNA ligase family protein [Caldilinea sp.]MDW8440761.1 class I tRNA ligase family protein [Caldilineaceae bacterium]
QGRKMSKSLGNALDPLDLIDEYGADALRFTLLTGSTPGNDLKLSVSRIEANRNFANKIWNAARFVVMKLQDAELPIDFSDPHSPTYHLPKRSLLGLADRWILSRFESVRRDVNRLIESWQIGEAGRQLYEFLWSEYCDWYIEASKVRLADAQSAEAQATRQALAYVLERTLRLLHPYMPFVTEAIWQNLPGMAGDGRSIMVMRWPEESGQRDPEAEEQFTRLQEVIRGIRNVRTEYDVPAARRIAALFSAGEYANLIKDNLPVIAALARLEPNETVIAAELTPPGKAATLVAGGLTVYLPLAGLIDLEAERRRIQAELESIDRQIQRIEASLRNDAFLSKAPAHVLERARARLAELQERRNQLVERSAELAE